MSYAFEGLSTVSQLLQDKQAAPPEHLVIKVCVLLS